ncbi:hypothetical protein BDR05DRAFT_1006063 [Suillus weaverae]|nr:hypothetical protein BDR05DRAFT_1006063 [Suillus weaverae]
MVIADWITAFIISTLVTNLLSSGLLAYHIWLIKHSVSTVRTMKGSMMPIVRILAQVEHFQVVVAVDVGTSEYLGHDIEGCCQIAACEPPAKA